MTYTPNNDTDTQSTPPMDGVIENGPLALYGYYPLYNNEFVADGVGNGSSHAHVFDGITYYMPNGIENFHGDWPQNEAPEGIPPPDWAPIGTKFTEINFPPKGPNDAGYIHYEIMNKTYYKWDGVKWDPYHDFGNVDRDNWTRVTQQQLLHPTDPDDYIQVNGVKDQWIDYLP